MKLINAKSIGKKKFISVEIGARKHKIRYVKSIKFCKNDKINYAGYYIGNEGVILINKKYCKTMDNTIETLIHEVVHGALYALGEHGLATNEKFVSRLSMVMAQSFLTLEIK